jgi:hypothetical protein
MASGTAIIGASEKVIEQGRQIAAHVLEAAAADIEFSRDRFEIAGTMYYSEAPWLVPNSMAAATGLMWHEVALTGTTAHEFEQQITDLQPFLSEHWRAHQPEERQPDL